MTSGTVTCAQCRATAIHDRPDAPCPRGWLRIDVLLESGETRHFPDYGYHSTRTTGLLCSQQCLARRLISITSGWGIPIHTTSRAGVGVIA